MIAATLREGAAAGEICRQNRGNYVTWYPI